MITPIGLMFFEWATAVNQCLAAYGDTVPVDPLDRWDDWASKTLLLPQVPGASVPRPGQFDDWRDWAHAFNRFVRY